MNSFVASFLYGLDGPLPPDAVDAYVQALVAVACQNGIVESEMRIVHGVADLLGAMPFTVSRAVRDAGAVPFDDFVARVAAHPRLAKNLYRDALLVVRADGEVSADEVGALRQLADKLGLDAPATRRAEEAADLLLGVRDRMRAS